MLTLGYSYFCGLIHSEGVGGNEGTQRKPSSQVEIENQPVRNDCSSWGYKKSIENLSQPDSPEIMQECFLVGHPSSHEPHPKGLN